MKTFLVEVETSGSGCVAYDVYRVKAKDKEAAIKKYSSKSPGIAVISCREVSDEKAKVSSKDLISAMVSDIIKEADYDLWKNIIDDPEEPEEADRTVRRMNKIALKYCGQMEFGANGT